jgi:hypothetical protein
MIRCTSISSIRVTCFADVSPRNFVSHRPALANVLGYRLTRPGRVAHGLASGRESRPGEFHPEALAEPYVTLSRHTAPIKEPPRIMVQCANSCGERRDTAATHRRARPV